MKTPLLLSYAFRPFFLLNGLFAIFIMLYWLLSLHGQLPAAVSPLWHAHEMLLGFALAAIAGFSLTAVANWTRREAVHGLPLGLLILSWLLGRLAMLMGGHIQPAMGAGLDMLFPLLLTILLGREIIGGKSQRNYKLVALLAAITIFNLGYHLGDLQIWPGAEQISIYLILHSILLLVIIIAGRIVPNFTANWLRQQGFSSLPHNPQWLTSLAATLSVATGIAMSFYPTHPISGILALAAAAVHGFRLSRWRGWATRSNPLLFIMHTAYAWIPIGYALLGLAIFGILFPINAALHALTMGAIGGIILAVTTRVGLGHTGRALQASRVTITAYWIYMLAVIIRIGGAISASHYLHSLDLAATGWILAFVLFLWVYWPILTRPRGQ